MSIRSLACGPICALVASACFAAAYVHARDGSAQRPRWEVEPGVEAPSYAAAVPTATNVNIEAVLLACEQAGEGKVLQLQLYLSDDGRLRPMGAQAAGLADDPRASISIDSEVFPARLVFAGDHVVLADDDEGRIPRLSDRVIEAMRTGRAMILQFELLAPRHGRKAAFDSSASVDLRAAGASEAIDAVRLCIGLSRSVHATPDKPS